MPFHLGNYLWRNMAIPSKQFFQVFLLSFYELKRNNPLRIAGATAFFATFALPPLFIILLQFFGLVVNKEKLRTELFHSLSMTIGNEATLQIQRVVYGMGTLAINPFAAVGGFLFLLFVATTLFKVIKDSINELWAIKVQANSGVKQQILSRLKSLVAIAFAGFLFFTSLFFDGVQAVVGNYIQAYLGFAAGILVLTISKCFSLLIVTVWFSLLFRLLTDAVPVWKVAITGGFVTGILFTIGKVILRAALPYKDLTSVFGAAGSFVLILLFLFYSSFILYYGACFTKMFSNYSHKIIKPREYAFAYEVTEKEE